MCYVFIFEFGVTSGSTQWLFLVLGLAMVGGLYVDAWDFTSCTISLDHNEKCLNK